MNLDATLATESYGGASDLDAIVEKLRGGGRARFAEVVEGRRRVMAKLGF